MLVSDPSCGYYLRVQPFAPGNSDAPRGVSFEEFLIPSKLEPRGRNGGELGAVLVEPVYISTHGVTQRSYDAFAGPTKNFQNQCLQRYFRCGSNENLARV